MPHAALWVVQLAFAVLSFISLASFNAARGFVGGAAGSARSSACSAGRFNAARGFVGGAALRERTKSLHL